MIMAYNLSSIEKKLLRHRLKHINGYTEGTGGMSIARQIATEVLRGSTYTGEKYYAKEDGLTNLVQLNLNCKTSDSHDNHYELQITLIDIKLKEPKCYTLFTPYLSDDIIITTLFGKASNGRDDIKINDKWGNVKKKYSIVNTQLDKLR